jgi:hypothetical protein
MAGGLMTQLDEVADSRLGSPAPRDPRRRPTLRVLAAGCGAVVAVIAVVIAVALAVTATHGDGGAGSRDNSASGGSMTGVVGSRWRVVSVADSHGSVGVPASLPAAIGFTRDGYVLGDDTVNGVDGKYRRTAAGYTVRDVAQTLVGTTGRDQVRERITNAVDAMFFTITGSGSDTPSPVIVEVKLTAGTLTLRRNAVVLTLSRDGAQPDSFGGSPMTTTTSSN